MDWEEAKDIEFSVKKILDTLDLPYINPSRIFCYRTQGSKSRSYARIWSFPKIFQRALDVEPAYVIEVLARHFDRLSDDDKIKVLIHELMHIPKNFSGALVPHLTPSGRRISIITNQLFKEYKKLRKN